MNRLVITLLRHQNITLKRFDSSCLLTVLIVDLLLQEKRRPTCYFLSIWY